MVYNYRAQKELIEKEQREDEIKHGARIVHRNDVLGQIREKEQGKISERNAFFEEGVRLDEEARLRRLKLDEAKKKKLGELRYVRQIYLKLPGMCIYIFA